MGNPARHPWKAEEPGPPNVCHYDCGLVGVANTVLACPVFPSAHYHLNVMTRRKLTGSAPSVFFSIYDDAPSRVIVTMNCVSPRKIPRNLSITSYLEHQITNLVVNPYPQ